MTLDRLDQFCVGFVLALRWPLDSLVCPGFLHVWLDILFGSFFVWPKSCIVRYRIRSFVLNSELGNLSTPCLLPPISKLDTYAQASALRQLSTPAPNSQFTPHFHFPMTIDMQRHQNKTRRQHRLYSDWPIHMSAHLSNARALTLTADISKIQSTRAPKSSRYMAEQTLSRHAKFVCQYMYMYIEFTVPFFALCRGVTRNAKLAPTLKLKTTTTTIKKDTKKGQKKKNNLIEAP